MTMRHHRPPAFHALVAWLLLLINVFAATADDLSTTVITLTSTETVRTLTTTVTSGQTTYATTEHLTAATTIRIPGATPTMAIGSGHGSYGGAEYQSAVINSTNYWRAQHQAKPVQWNDTLAEFAQNHAQKCIWEHSGGPYGENLAEGFGTPTLGIDAWAAEEKKYDYSSGKFSEATGHFTQLVWENTRTVGCGAVHCNSNADNGAHGWYMVCEYFPPGNVVGAFKENVSKQGMVNGKLGFGAASRVGGVSRMLLALAAVSGFVVICL